MQFYEKKVMILSKSMFYDKFKKQDFTTKKINHDLFIYFFILEETFVIP